eukprot:jgi/Hompol1/1923/HPOL_002844-RA
MRVIIKGGTWKNTEDEILKAAVMKYGKNQWARISSLLTRKTPKQCKARCDDVRKLRPGEIDPDPETRPARPDPVDMDEDEKEMLSEARARLANTQGKKAKRKAREKQLEEARRLAFLQKRRELKAAGIETKIFRKLKGMDYNADIPFYKPQPAGFWDINAEIARERTDKAEFTGELLSKLDGKRRMEIEEIERKKDFKKQKLKKEKGEFVPPEALRAAAKSDDLVTSARGKLSLPAPQVSEAELEAIVKMGAVGENIRAIVDADGGSSAHPKSSSELLSDYSTFRAPTPMRTPRVTAATQNSIQQQARNLKAMTESQTPLLGGSVDIEGEIDFSAGATPRTTIAATPNPLATHLTPRAGSSAGQTTDGASSSRGSVAGTPRVSQAVTGSLFGRTPVRDQMGINTPRSEFSGMSAAGGETPRALKTQQEMLRKQLSDHFASLPKPKNEIEITIIGDDDQENHKDFDSDMLIGDEDAEDLAARDVLRRKAEQEAKLKRRSLAVQRGLPRPVVSLSLLEQLYGGDDDDNDDDTKNGDETALIEAMIRKEKALLIQRDAVMHPCVGQPPLAVSTVLPKFTAFPDEDLSQAADLIATEFESMKLQGMLADPAHMIAPSAANASSDNDDSEDSEDPVRAYFLSPITHQFVCPDDLDPNSRREFSKARFQMYRQAMAQHAAKAKKLDTKLISNSIYANWSIQ